MFLYFAYLCEREISVISRNYFNVIMVPKYIDLNLKNTKNNRKIDNKIFYSVTTLIRILKFVTKHDFTSKSIGNCKRATT